LFKQQGSMRARTLLALLPNSKWAQLGMARFT